MTRMLAAFAIGSLLLSSCDDPPKGPGTSPSEGGGGAAPGPAMADVTKDGKPADRPAPTREQLADWTERLKKLGATYKYLSRVDDLSRWAPQACAMAQMPAPVPWSTADAKDSPHGQKLYALWAKDVEAYGKISGFWLIEFTPEGIERLKKVEGADGCSQVVVKESFEPVELKPEEKDWRSPDSDAPSGPRTMRPAVHDGKRYRPGAPKGLFVMLRLDPKTPATDDGWVYGTVSTGGDVTGVGLMASCMACHATAPHGRLFGLAKPEVPAPAAGTSPTR